MTVVKRYILRVFMSQKYITANVIDRNNGRIVATSSSVEQAIKKGMGTSLRDTRAASAVGEVLAMRLRVEGLDHRGIHVDVDKPILQKGFIVRSKLWALLHSLQAQGVKLVLRNDSHGPPPPPSSSTT